MRNPLHRLVTCLFIGILGCGGGGASDQPETAPVTGVVKMDGQPLANATVSFVPERGRPSTGVTNENGEYELDYNRTTKGAKLGKHTVAITTYEETVDDDDNAIVKTPEKVPDVYNVNSTLTAIIKEGGNDVPFDLDSKKGRIIQPE